MKRPVALLGWLAASLMLVVSLQVRPALATPPACDSPIYTSITLDGNMSCPGTNGLIIAANGVTVNLNSHTISGSNLGISDSGFSRISILGPGTISGFATGVYLDSST